MVAVVASASNCFSFPVIISTSLCAVDPIARGNAAENITTANSTPMPSTTRSAGTAKRNGADEILIIPASTDRSTLNPSSEIGKASADETANAACRIL